MNNLLLHTCCAPCSSAIVEALLKEGIRPVIYYCNPNIYPFEEYVKRRDECARYAAECGVGMVEAEYNHAVWLQCVSGLENEPERGARCVECFRHRLLSSAQYAVHHGFDILATTLASSRWKNLDQVNAAGRWAVEKANAGAVSWKSLDESRVPLPVVDAIGNIIRTSEEVLAESRGVAPESRGQSPVAVAPESRGQGSDAVAAGSRGVALESRGVALESRGVAPESRGQGSDAVAPEPLVWWDRNWRKGGLQERRNELIREKGFYNQLWCGCEFSLR